MSYTDSSSTAGIVRPETTTALPLRGLPSHCAPCLQKQAIFVDLRIAQPDYTQSERDDFLCKDLGLTEEDVQEIFLDPSTLLLRIVLASEELYTATLARLSAGVPWTAAGGTNVYGWPTAAPLHPIRLSGVPKSFPLSEIIAHFREFGDVSWIYQQSHDKQWTSAFNGVVHLSVRIAPGKVLPHFVEILGQDGVLVERFSVHSETHRRYCFRCGSSGHLGPFCRASSYSTRAPPGLWSTLRLRPKYLRPVNTAVSPAQPSGAAGAAAGALALSRAAVEVVTAAAASLPAVAAGLMHAVAPAAAHRSVSPTVAVSLSTTSASEVSDAADDRGDAEPFQEHRCRRRRRSPPVGLPSLLRTSHKMDPG